MNEEQQYALDTALVIAAARGQKDLVHLLLKAGANIHTSDDAPLIRAAEEGHTETVDWLLLMGADTHGNDAILHAANRGQAGTLRVLFQWAEKHPEKSDNAPSPGPTP